MAASSLGWCSICRGDAESNEGRDGEQLSAMARAARLVVKAAREGSLALCESARAWQRVHEPTWQGGTVGERDTEDANDGIDDEEGGGVDDGFGDEDDGSDDSGDDGDDDEDGDGDGEQGDDAAAARAWDARIGGRAAGGDGGAPLHAHPHSRALLLHALLRYR